jgi:hypothetical protein
VSAFAVALLIVLPVTVMAQKPVTQGAQVSETFTIEAVDYGARLVTLKDAQGETETIYCGPEVERFNALKVGDRVTFRYYESMVSPFANRVPRPHCPVAAASSARLATGRAAPSRSR